MFEYGKSLIDQGPEAAGVIELWMTVKTASACLLHLGERRDRLAPAHRNIFERLWNDEQLQQRLHEFVADVQGINEPALLMAGLNRHASVIEALDKRLHSMFAECGCDS